MGNILFYSNLTALSVNFLLTSNTLVFWSLA